MGHVPKLRDGLEGAYSTSHYGSGSKILINMGKDNKFSGTISTLVQCIHNLLPLNWSTQFRHTWRECNHCTDWLTNFSLSLDSLSCTILETPPNKLHKLFFDDIFGGCVYLVMSH